MIVLRQKVYSKTLLRFLDDLIEGDVGRSKRKLADLKERQKKYLEGMEWYKKIGEGNHDGIVTYPPDSPEFKEFTRKFIDGVRALRGL